MQRMEYYMALENLKRILPSDKKPSWKGFNLHDSNYTASWKGRIIEATTRTTTRDSLGLGFMVDE